MKKGLGIGMLCVLLLSAGCAAKNNSQASTKNDAKNQILVSSTKDSAKKATKKGTAKTGSKTKTTTPKKEVVLPPLWSPAKKTAMQQFIAEKNKTETVAKFKEIVQGKNLSYFGVQLPDSFISGGTPFTVNDAPATMAWSTDGKGTAGYQILAVYVEGSNTISDNIANFLLTIHEGKPEIIYGLGADFYATQEYKFATSTDQEMNDAFTKIVSADQNGEDAFAAPKNALPEVAGKTPEQVTAAAVWAMEYPENTPAEIDIYASPAGENVAPLPGSVTFPVPSVHLEAVPAAGGHLDYTDNGDGTVSMYYLQRRYSGAEFLDPNYAAKWTQEALDKAERFPLPAYAAEQLQPLLNVTQTK